MKQDYVATAVKGLVMVELDYIGEGIDGDYNPSNPHDEPLMRFAVYRREGCLWEAIDDSSYCTQVLATETNEILDRVALYILEEVFEPVKDGHPIKKLCERLSWLERKWLDK